MCNLVTKLLEFVNNITFQPQVPKSKYMKHLCNWLPIKKLTQRFEVFQEVFGIFIAYIPLIKLINVLLLATVVLRFNQIFISAKRKILLI